MEKKACSDSLEEESKMESVMRLRNSIEILFKDTYIGLCTRTSHPVKDAARDYEEKRRQMHRLGMSRQDMDYYDSRFKSFPWDIVGLEVPILKAYEEFFSKQI